jgi:HSP90 family molecular chaperone
MPIEIHSSSSIDDSGEERARVPVTPHPVVRGGQDWCYISQPEHLTALLHLRVFRTSAPDSSSALSLSSDMEQQQQHEDLPQRLQRQPQTELTRQRQRQDKQLLGREFLLHQKKARQLALEQSKKRHAKAVVSSPRGCVSVSSQQQQQEEEGEEQEQEGEGARRRQERVLARVLEDIRVSRADKEQQKASEKVLATPC